MASSTRTTDPEETQASKLTSQGLNFQSPFESSLKILYSECPVFINPSPPNNIISATPQSPSISFQPPYNSLLIAPAYYQYQLSPDRLLPTDKYDKFSPPTLTLIHRKPFGCDICGKRYFHEKALIAHNSCAGPKQSRIRQTVIVPEVMSVCGKIKCPLCGKRFTKTCSYSSHYKAKHRPDTP